MIKKHILSILLLSIFSTFSSADSPFGEVDIAQVILQKAQKYNLDYRMLYTIASIESDFEPMAIAVETSFEKAQVLRQLASESIKIRTGTTYHSKIALVSIYPDSYETAVFIITRLEALGFTFDVGLMQINTVNFDRYEVEEMLSPEQNLEKACKHLSGCVSRFKNKAHQVECYNRGGGNLSKMLRKGKAYYPYWDRYKQHWNKYFLTCNK